jgi:hypothetical protein
MNNAQALVLVSGSVVRNVNSGTLSKVSRVDATDTRGIRLMVRTLKADGQTTTGPLRNVAAALYELA